MDTILQRLQDILRYLDDISNWDHRRGAFAKPTQSAQEQACVTKEGEILLLTALGWLRVKVDAILQAPTLLQLRFVRFSRGQCGTTQTSHFSTSNQLMVGQSH